jgi:hypothetical protein
MGIRLASIISFLSLAVTAHAVPVSYPVNLSTSKGNPVTDILILESDGDGSVDATVYGSDLPGHGTSVISHEAAFAPGQALVIGLTEGCDENGNDQIQLVMFLDDDFAAAHQGVKYSETFPGARHSTTIANLEAAVAGDTALLAWFTDTFFSGPAAGAAFVPGGSFTVAEFTVLNMVGGSAAAGNWMLMGFASLPGGDPNAQSGFITGVIDETAKVDNGPFDIELTVDDSGQFAIDKTVINNTGTDWVQFVLELGTGSGANFVPSAPGDDLRFLDTNDTREETGAFPNVAVTEDRIVFTGFLANGGTARFIFFVETDTESEHMITLRQSAVAGGTVAAPALRPWAIAVLILLTSMLAYRKLRSA